MNFHQSRRRVLPHSVIATQVPSLVIRRLSLDIPRRRRGGFALLITITLLAFLVLLLVSLASLTRVETQVASNAQTMAQARQNALTALNIALGQLQKHTGPDQRVTARADIVKPATIPWTGDPVTVTNITAANARSADKAAIDGYWNASRNRNWTGVWQNTNTPQYDPTITYDPEAPADYNPIPSAPIWLVSGSEISANTFSPTDMIPSATFSAITAPDAPLKAFGAGNHTYRLLVGAKSANIASANNIDRAVLVPNVSITANAPGSNTPVPVGNYAWWVGDEGIKARANLVDTDPANVSVEANRKRLQTAPRLAIEAMKGDAADGNNEEREGLAPYYPKVRTEEGAEMIKSILNPSQLGLLNNTPAFHRQLNKRFHDITTHSKGVLADVKNGGLKRDLTFILSQPNLNDFRSALNAAYDGADVAPPSESYNPIISTGTTIYANLNDRVKTLATSETPARPALFDLSATWQQLWSFYNMGSASAGAFNASEEASPRLHTATQHGIGPLIIQSKLYFRLRFVGSEPVDPDGTDRKNPIWIDLIPVVVLANPYNVPLAKEDYFFSYKGSQRVRLYFGSADPNNPEPTAAQFSTLAYPNDNAIPTNLYTGNIKLTIEAPVMLPGRAYVFTLADPLTTIPPSTAEQENMVIRMTNDFFPKHRLTFNTTKKILSDKHQAVLRPQGGYRVQLYSKNYTSAFGDETLFRNKHHHTYTADNAGNTFFVYPVASGERDGAGFGAFVHDANYVSQQSTFYQVNYRAILIDNAAGNDYHRTQQSPVPPPDHGNNIAISWARARPKSGALTGTPHPTIFNDLLFKSGSTKEVRWGLYNTGDLAAPTVAPAAILGTNTGFENILYDVPQAGGVIASLGRLQHFNTTGHLPMRSIEITKGTEYTANTHSFQNNYPLGNSYPNIYNFRHKIMDGDGGMGFQYDGSYILNDIFWDRFYFSTYPPSGAPDLRTNHLLNTRYRPFREHAIAGWDDETSFRGNGSPAVSANSRKAAENLLVEGAFNINSTSVDAWKALFSGLKDVPVGDETSEANLSAPYARTLYQTGGAPGAKTGASENSWRGFRNLSEDEVEAIANEMVMQVRKRGPFLSLAEFINRRVVLKADDSLRRGISGALQSAIDRVINQTDDVHPELRTKSRKRSAPDNNTRIVDDDVVLPTGISGFPGYLLQSDILSTLAPSLTARSDTFKIRTYGDVVNPTTSTVEARAWCEAVVQRIPDYVVPRNGQEGNYATDTASNPDNINFGRRYKIVSFRWLGANDI